MEKIKNMVGYILKIHKYHDRGKQLIICNNDATYRTIRNIQASWIDKNITCKSCLKIIKKKKDWLKIMRKNNF